MLTAWPRPHFASLQFLLDVLHLSCELCSLIGSGRLHLRISQSVAPFLLCYSDCPSLILVTYFFFRLDCMTQAVARNPCSFPPCSLFCRQLVFCHHRSSYLQLLLFCHHKPSYRLPVSCLYLLLVFCLYLLLVFFLYLLLVWILSSTLYHGNSLAISKNDSQLACQFDFCRVRGKCLCLCSLA